MTTTPEYIRKCEMAEEIQAMRAPCNRQDIGDGYELTYPLESGDFVAMTGSEDRGENEKTDVVVYGDTIYLPSINYMPDGKSELEFNFVGFDEGDFSGDAINKIIWLPRLDQLLDIATGMEISIGEVNAILGENREEKLLTVIMRNKFGKKWDGEKWLTV